MPNRIREWRERRKLSQEELAELTNCHKAQIQHLEAGRRKLNEDWLVKLGIALNVRINDLLKSEVDTSLIPLVGYVGAGTTMKCTNMTNEPIDWIDPIDIGFENFTRGTMFVQVQGNSMIGSADDGDYLWLNSNDAKQGIAIEDLINQRAVVICKDGFNYYKKLRKGSKRGLYNLHSINTPEVMEDVALQCGYYVHGVVYKRK